MRQLKASVIAKFTGHGKISLLPVELSRNLQIESSCKKASQIGPLLA